MLQASNRPWFYLLIFADLVLRGITLYRSARKDQKGWFVALLIVNSMGILPLVYLFLNKDKMVLAPKIKTSAKGRKTKK